MICNIALVGCVPFSSVEQTLIHNLNEHELQWNLPLCSHSLCITLKPLNNLCFTYEFVNTCYKWSCGWRNWGYLIQTAKVCRKQGVEKIKLSRFDIPIINSVFLVLLFCVFLFCFVLLLLWAELWKADIPFQNILQVVLEHIIWEISNTQGILGFF